MVGRQNLTRLAVPQFCFGFRFRLSSRSHLASFKHVLQVDGCNGFEGSMQATGIAKAAFYKQIRDIYDAAGPRGTRVGTL
jgi:hypothetical protein